MAPVSWMPISAAATQLGLSTEQVEQLAADGSLHGKAIGGDHLSISAKSVQDYLTPVDALCVTIHGVARHIRDASREGRALCGRWATLQATDFDDDLLMCGQCVRLRDIKTAASSALSPELAALTGDRLAANGADHTGEA